MLVFITHFMYIIEWFCLYLLTSIWMTGKESLIVTLIFAGIFDVAFLFNRWKKRFAPIKYETETKAVLLTGPCLLYFCSAYQKIDKYMVIALTITVLLIILHFLCLYWQGIKDYMKQNHSFKGMPEKNIRNNNGKMITYILIISFIVILLAGFVRFDDAFLWLGKRLLGCIVWVIAYIFDGFSKLIELILASSGQEAHTYDTSVMTVYFEESGGAGLSKIIYTVMGFFTIVAFIIFIGKEIIGLFERDDKNNDSEKDEMIKRDYTEIKEAIIKNKVVHVNSSRTKNGRIRERYRKVVKKNLKGNIPNTYTVGDITREIAILRKGSGMEEIEDITTLYENERYGK